MLGTLTSMLGTPGRPRSFTREDSFISEVEDSDLVSPTTRSPAAMTASRSHSAESYSSAAAAAAARARSVGMARIRVRMPVDDSGIFSSPEPGNRSYDSPDEGDMAAMRPRAGTLHSADAVRAASRESVQSVQSTDIDRPASRQSSRFSETGRYGNGRETPMFFGFAHFMFFGFAHFMFCPFLTRFQLLHAHRR